jgi:hypothetical protein
MAVPMSVPHAMPAFGQGTRLPSKEDTTRNGFKKKPFSHQNHIEYGCLSLKTSCHFA